MNLASSSMTHAGEIPQAIYKSPCGAGFMMPSFFIRNCRVDRLIPSRAAAPFGPATTHAVS
jgi:hypothetical protein